MTKEYIKSIYTHFEIYKKLNRNRFFIKIAILSSGILILTLGQFLAIIYTLLTFWKFEEPIISQLKIAIKHPLMNPEIRGLAYHIPLAVKHNKNLEDLPLMQNKLYWNKYFNKMGIFSPKVHGVIRNGILRLDIKMDKNKVYIIKRIQDTGGSNTQLFNEKKLPKDSTYIVQEYIQGYKEIAENWRITTLLSKDTGKSFVWQMLLTINNNPNHIRTNCNTFYKNYEIIDSQQRLVKTQKLDFHDYNRKMIEEAREVAMLLHNNLEFKVNCIGWDVILSKDGACFLEGNIVPGILRRNDICYYDRIKNYLKNI